MSDFSLMLPPGQTVEALAAQPNLPPWGALQIDFAGALSRALMGTPAARTHPELMALGYWLRPGNLQPMLERLRQSHAQTALLPRGLVFHLAPGNVDTIFVYSWMLSLLCGNRSIVRLSSRASAGTEALLAVLGELLAQPAWQAIAQCVAFVRYERDDAITARLSARCDMRVIWGGDATVNTVRALPLPPHATELCFPDKFSLTVLRASAVGALAPAALAALAKALVNDAFTFGQQACSSPRLVLWLGDEADTEAARTKLWPTVEAAANAVAHGLGDAEHLNKDVFADLLAMNADVRIEPGRGLVRRIWLNQPAVHADTHCGGGLFHESRISALTDLLPLLSRRIQTVSHHGFAREELLQFARDAGPCGIDRMVPVGQALDFAPVWDGVNLWLAFTREIDIRA